MKRKNDVDKACSPTDEEKAELKRKLVRERKRSTEDEG